MTWKSEIDDARLRARRRKSSWNILLIPSIAIPLGAGWWALAMGFSWAHAALHPLHDSGACKGTIAGVLFMVAPLFVLLGPSMMLGNAIVHAVPQVRTRLDAEAGTVRGTRYREAQHQLLRFTLIITSVGLMAAAIGILVPR